MPKYLINLSNHKSNSWSEDQKEGWLQIFDIPFPNISPQATTEEVAELVEKYFEKINDLAYENIPEDDDVYVMLQGEFTFCYLLYEVLKMHGYIVVVPTTERIVEERVKDDGTIEKTSIFKFVQWRYLNENNN